MTELSKTENNFQEKPGLGNGTYAVLNKKGLVLRIMASRAFSRTENADFQRWALHTREIDPSAAPVWE